jgi:hypothetical protein
VVAAGAAEPGGGPGVLDGQLAEWDEDDSRPGLGRLLAVADECPEAGPGAVEAVAGERPPAGEAAAAAVVGVDVAGGSEHRRVRLIRVGEDLAGGGLGEVAGEDVAAGADGRAPAGAPVDRRDGGDHVDRLGQRHLEAAELDRHGHPVDARLTQDVDHGVGQAAAPFDLFDVVGDDVLDGDGVDGVGHGDERYDGERDRYARVSLRRKRASQ